MATFRGLRTKIVATLGPSCASPNVLESMVRSGMSVARVNFAHGAMDDHVQRMHAVRRAAQRASHPLAVMGDLAGPKLRIGELRGGKAVLESGKTVALTSRPVEGTADEISVAEPSLFRDVRPGDPVFLADGSLELRVESVRPTEIACKVVTGGLLTPRKGLNVPRTRLRMAALTPKDVHDLRRAVREGFDILALSFVRTVHDVKLARRHLGRSRIGLIAKIEKREATQNLSAILDAADGAMVARGDLAVETAYDEVPLLQKRIIRLANDLAKPVITATQMLKSMVESPHPTRAEATDVANAILDGTDAVMLSEETAMGQHPVRAVDTMARIARRAEAALDPEVFRARARDTRFVAIEVSAACVRVAHNLGARAIVTPTGRGATARFVARLRPSVPILALTRHQSTARLLHLTWGVEPVHVSGLGGLEATLRYGLNLVKKLGWARPRDRVVITAGYPPEGHASNLLTVQEVG